MQYFLIKCCTVQLILIYVQHNSLEFIAIQLNAYQQYSAIQFSTVQYSALQFRTVQYSLWQSSVFQCISVQLSAVLFRYFSAKWNL